MEEDGEAIPVIGVEDEAGAESVMPLRDYLVLCALRDSNQTVYDRIVGLAGAVYEQVDVLGLTA